jgi:hypothetical protein
VLVLSQVPVEAPVEREAGSLEEVVVEACRVPMEEEEEALLVREPVVALSETGQEPLVEKEQRKALGRVRVQVQVMVLGRERVEELVQELGLGYLKELERELERVEELAQELGLGYLKLERELELERDEGLVQGLGLGYLKERGERVWVWRRLG